jgi:hypothetical protein
LTPIIIKIFPIYPSNAFPSNSYMFLELIKGIK